MRNKHSFWWWVCAALAVLTTILIIDLKPWRKSRSVVSDQWPYHDMTKGPYSKDFDSICTLLFIKGNKLVAFSSIYRNVIDFSSLSKTPYKATDKIRIINKFATDC